MEKNGIFVSIGKCQYLHKRITQSTKLVTFYKNIINYKLTLVWTFIPLR